jgi:hypothetical protein
LKSPFKRILVNIANKVITKYDVHNLNIYSKINFDNAGNAKLISYSVSRINGEIEYQINAKIM